MKKILMLICSVFMVSCAYTTPYPSSRVVAVYQTVNRVPVNRLPVMTGYYRGPSQRDLIQQELNQRQINAAQMNEVVSGVMGPNCYSAGLLNYQNQTREVNARMQNPWLQHFSDSNYYGYRY
jgi:hypothetical protein